MSIKYFKRAISYSAIFVILTAVIFAIAAVVSKEFIKQNLTRTIENNFKSVQEIGTISFHLPNHVNISHLIIQRQTEGVKIPTRLDNVQCTLKIIPLLLRKIVFYKIYINETNFENRLLIKELVTDKFSYENDVVSANIKCKINEGPTTIKGTLDLSKWEPIYDVIVNATDVNITQDMPAIGVIPIFATKNCEMGGVLSLSGNAHGKGFDKKNLNKNLSVNMQLIINDGYIRGNKLISSILGIAGVKDTYQFDSMEAIIQVKDGKANTPKINIRGPIMNLNASGTTEFEGKIRYDAVVKFNKENLHSAVEKIVSSILKQNELLIEIRGTVDDPKVSVKISKDNIENLIKGLVNTFLDKKN